MEMSLSSDRKRFTILINASVHFFTNWLETHTRNLPERPILLKKSRILPDFARKSRQNEGKMQWVIQGTHFYPDLNYPGSEKERFTGPLITIEILPLSKSRFEVIATCNQPFMRQYFSQLTEEIVRRWPDLYKDSETYSARLVSKAIKRNVKQKRKYSPNQTENLRRWQATWAKIKPFVLDGYSVPEVFAKIKNKDKYMGVQCSIDTLRKIIRAGTNKELDL